LDAPGRYEERGAILGDEVRDQRPGENESLEGVKPRLRLNVGQGEVENSEGVNWRLRLEIEPGEEEN
jgi:hypothetical protein